MTDRHAILSAKFERLAAVVQDGNNLKGTPKSDRPNSASLDAVRAAQNAAAEELRGDFESVTAVEQVETPTERLQ